MGKHYLQFLGMFLLFAAGGFAQESEPILEEGFFSKDSIVKSVRLAEKEVYGHFRGLSKGSETGFVGGYVESIFHESIDSAIVQISVEGSPSENLIAAKGLFHLVHNRPGKHIEIQITHPDYHNFDTTFVLQNEGSSICFIRLVPRYKILIRGRVFAGKIPLEGVDVDLRFEGENYSLKTIGCFYDNENYWNCLFNGMFKKDLIAENLQVIISMNL